MEKSIGFGGRAAATRASLQRKREWQSQDAEPCVTPVDLGATTTTAPVGCCPLAGGDQPQLGRNAAAPPRLNETHEGSVWSVETEGEQAIGPEGKTTFRARFVASSCDRSSSRGGEGEGGGGPGSGCGGRGCRASSEQLASSGSTGDVLPEAAAGESGGVVRSRTLPSLVLLRVSVIEEEAALLLGRGVRGDVGVRGCYTGSGLEFSLVSCCGVTYIAPHVFMCACEMSKCRRVASPCGLQNQHMARWPVVVSYHTYSSIVFWYFAA